MNKSESKIKLVNSWRIDLTALFYVLTYFVTQFNLLKHGGTTIDERSLDSGNAITFNKLQTILNLKIIQDGEINSVLKTVDKMETYGQFVSLQQFIFSRKLYGSNLLNNYFVENDLFVSFYSKISFLRYIYLNIYICIFLVVFYFIISKYKDKKFGLIFIVILSLIPSFNGHGLFNQKDITFLIHVFLACYLIVQNKFFINHKIFVLTTLLSGLAMSLRISAIAFIGLAVIFSIIYIIKSKSAELNVAFGYLLKFTALTLFFYYLLSPGSWFAPLDFLTESIKQQVFLDWNGSTLTNGKFILSSEMNRFYLLTWFFYKLPIIYVLILSLSFLGIYFKRLHEDIFFVFSIFFVLIVNIAFLLIKPEVYDGIRQFLFLLPFIAYITTTYLTFFQKKFFLALPIVVFYLFYTQYSLGPYKYVYLNEFVTEDQITFECNNVDGCGDWLTDYWGFSAKNLADNINKNKFQDVYICKPFSIWDPYLDESLNPIFNDPSKIKKETFLLATIYRPRYLNDGCNFYKNNISYDCELIDKTVIKLRNSYIDLNYLKECTLK